MIKQTKRVIRSAEAALEYSGQPASKQINKNVLASRVTICKLATKFAHWHYKIGYKRGCVY